MSAPLPPTSPAQRLQKLALDLLQIPSLSYEEAQICRHIQNWANHQPHTHVLEIAPHNLLIYAGDLNPETPPPIVLLGHMDTVAITAGCAKPYYDPEQQILHGRGAADMKGGLAVMQALWESFTAQTTAAPLPFCMVFYSGEEGAYARNGLENVLQNVPWLKQTRLAICLEPTHNEIHMGCVGSLQIEVECRGQLAHAARPWEGYNAIHQASLCIAGCAAQAVAPYTQEGLTFYDVIQCTKIAGGVGSNVVPERCMFNINARYAPIPSPEAGAQRMHQRLEQLLSQQHNTTWRILDHAPAGAVLAKHHPVLQTLHQEVQRPCMAKQAWTDVGRLGHHGIAALNFGPGNPRYAHQDDELISLASMTENYTLLLRFLKRIQSSVGI